MKRLLFATLLFISSCSLTDEILAPSKTVTDEILAPSKTVQNSKCEDIPAIKIFQVLDNFSLASVCEYGEYTGDLYCVGYTVYLSKQKGELYFDDKIIKPSDGKCISFDGVYNYETKKGDDKTVPKVKIVDSEVPNPEYRKWEKEQAKKKE